MLFYFAYGSNLSTARLRARIAQVRPVVRALLPGHRLCFHKAGRDGSAKCDAAHTGARGDRVFGVVFEIARSDLQVLDRIEGSGYVRRSVSLLTTGGLPLQAVTYLATGIDPGLLPYDWYRQHVLIGAREHCLPQAWLDRLGRIPCIPDPDPSRRERELAIYP
ncbi:MAG: gamma-glutamylcyclotransferase [Gammaproteobacteria bacterium]|nr:MAG: gamma-glutamylcyclotransferase [Gammaproteobacteria bacterium]